MAAHISRSSLSARCPGCGHADCAWKRLECESRVPPRATVSVECLNCARPVTPENEHLGSQGWTCEMAPNSLRAVSLLIGALTAQNSPGV